MAAGVLQGAPQGFYDAVEVLNKLPQDILAEMCHEVMQFLQYKQGSINVKRLHSRSSATDDTMTESLVQSAVNALTYLFRSAAKLKVSSNDLSMQLKANLVFSEKSVATIEHIWGQQGKLLVAVDSAQKLLNVGQLIDFDWKLGVSISSDSCRNLNSPFVTMTIKVADPSGHVITRSFEMSIPEFQNFTKQMKDMASVLENV